MEREISRLKANPANPRGMVERDAAFFELVASIKAQGVLQSCLITPNDLIIAGHRRIEAAEEAGLKAVPVIVKEMSKIDQLKAMLAENLQRADLNVLQEGASYALLIEYGLTISQIAKAIGLKSQRVNDCIVVQGLSPEIRRQFAWGALPVSCASPLATLRPTEQQRWVDIAIQRKLNGPALRSAIQKATDSSSNGHSPKERKGKTGPHVRQMIGQLEEMDELLDQFPDYRQIQALLRQAASLLIERVAGTRKANVHKA